MSYHSAHSTLGQPYICLWRRKKCKDYRTTVCFRGRRGRLYSFIFHVTHALMFSKRSSEVHTAFASALPLFPLWQKLRSYLGTLPLSNDSGLAKLSLMLRIEIVLSLATEVRYQPTKFAGAMVFIIRMRLLWRRLRWRSLNRWLVVCR